MHYVVCFILSVLCAASIVMALTRTPLLVFIFNFILKPLGYLRGSDMWKLIPPETTTLEEFQDVISWKASKRPHYLIADLLTCKYCLSFHAAFWMTLAFSIILSINPLFAFVGAVAEPIIINILLSYAK